MDSRIGILIRNGKTIYYAFVPCDGRSDIYVEHANLAEIEGWLGCGK